MHLDLCLCVQRARLCSHKVLPHLAGGELRRGLVSQYISPQSGVAQIFDYREQQLAGSDPSLLSSEASLSSRLEAAPLMHLLVEQPNVWRTILVLGTLLTGLSVFALRAHVHGGRAPYLTITAAATEEDGLRLGGGATRF